MHALILRIFFNVQVNQYKEDLEQGTRDREKAAAEKLDDDRKFGLELAVLQDDLKESQQSTL